MFYRHIFSFWNLLMLVLKPQKQTFPLHSSFQCSSVPSYHGLLSIFAWTKSRSAWLSPVFVCSGERNMSPSPCRQGYQLVGALMRTPARRRRGGWGGTLSLWITRNTNGFLPFELSVSPLESSEWNQISLIIAHAADLGLQMRRGNSGNRNGEIIKRKWKAAERGARNIVILCH